MKNDRVQADLLGIAESREEDLHVQLEGLADEPQGPELAELEKVYLARFPDGTEREAWPGIAYFRLRPIWVRYSDFTRATPLVLQFDAKDLEHEDLACNT